ncbi:MAG: hypothetical protein IPJ90_14970 [Anaerolineaceae bacterium]|nr:hypothetical protein [Anaerolineaceae bacterium]
MEKKQNTSFLLKQWIPAVIVLGILLYATVALIQRGNYIMIPAMAIAGIFLWRTYAGTTAEFNKLLKSSSPQPLIDFYDKKLGQAKMPHKDAHLVSSKAFAYTLYGDFDSARAETDKIDWRQKPPFFQAQHMYLLALWAYLENHEFQQGVNLAKEARRLVNISKSFPGAKTSLDTYDTVIDIGELLSGNSSPEIIARLESKIDKSLVVMKILAAWGLEGFYIQSGQTEKAKEMREILTNFAPYCKGLSSINK